METWSPALIPPELAQLDHRPESCHRSTTEDHLAVLVALFGRGTPNDPVRLLVELTMPELEEGAVLPCHNCEEPLPAWNVVHLRLPTLEELQDILNHFTPEGTLVAFPHLVSFGPEAQETDTTDAQKTAVWINQVGAVEGSPAARRFNIIHNGGGGPHGIIQ